MDRPSTSLLHLSSASRLLLRGVLCVLLFGAVFYGVHLLPSSLNSSEAGASAEYGWIGGAAHAGAFADGEKIYMTRCMSCHQINGQGVSGVFPPLDGTEWVTGDKGRLIRIVLHGVTGEMEVNGVKYSGAMPPWGSFLSDAEVAEVATYIRSSWSNQADAVTPEEVAQVREAHTDRKQPWTAEELSNEENQGIPGQ